MCLALNRTGVNKTRRKARISYGDYYSTRCIVLNKTQVVPSEEWMDGRLSTLTQEFLDTLVPFVKCPLLVAKLHDPKTGSLVYFSNELRKLNPSEVHVDVLEGYLSLLNNSIITCSANNVPLKTMFRNGTLVTAGEWCKMTFISRPSWQYLCTTLRIKGCISWLK